MMDDVGQTKSKYGNSADEGVNKNVETAGKLLSWFFKKKELYSQILFNLIKEKRSWTLPIVSIMFISVIRFECFWDHLVFNVKQK